MVELLVLCAMLSRWDLSYSLSCRDDLPSTFYFWSSHVRGEHEKIWKTIAYPVLYVSVTSFVSFLFLYFWLFDYQVSWLNLLPFFPSSNSSFAFVRYLCGFALISLEVIAIGTIVWIGTIRGITRQLYDEVLKEENVTLSKVLTDQTIESTLSTVTETISWVIPDAEFWLREGFRWMFAIITTPLNVVPILGWAIYFVLNGYLLAWDLQTRYFQLTGKRRLSEQLLHIMQYPDIYLQLGVSAFVLQFIPLIGPLSYLSSVVGAALVASDIDRAGRKPY